MTAPRAVDISGWDADKRSILYQPQGGDKVFGILSGLEIGSDGRAILFLFDPKRANVWSPAIATYGEGPGQYKFVNPLPEIQALHDLLNGVKAGAPLPEEVPEVVVDPLDDKSLGVTSSRRSAAKVSRV